MGRTGPGARSGVAAMNITIPIPDGLDTTSAARAEGDAREAAGVRLYRDGQFSLGQLAIFLGIERDRLDEVLDRHAVGILSSVSAPEIAQQADALRRLRESRPRIISKPGLCTSPYPKTLIRFSPRRKARERAPARHSGVVPGLPVWAERDVCRGCGGERGGGDQAALNHA